MRWTPRSPATWSRWSKHALSLGGTLGEFLFEIVMRRYETRSTIMTSNRPLEDWGKLIGDVASATAILDRFLHHAEIVTMNGRSYRLRNRAVHEADGGPAHPSSESADAAADPGSKPAISPTGSAVPPMGSKRRRTKAETNEATCQP